MPITSVGPTGEAEISVELKTPAIPTQVESFWRLRTPEGRLFGAVLFVDIAVEQGAPALALRLPAAPAPGVQPTSQVPTATPSATPLPPTAVPTVAPTAVPTAARATLLRLILLLALGMSASFPYVLVNLSIPGLVFRKIFSFSMNSLLTEHAKRCQMDANPEYGLSFQV